MRPMSEAPRDGTRILLKYVMLHYRKPTREELLRVEAGELRRMASQLGATWMPSGEKWEECFWRDETEATGSPPHWEPWAGSFKTFTTHHIAERHALGWVELPQE